MLTRYRIAMQTAGIRAGMYRKLEDAVGCWRVDWEGCRREDNPRVIEEWKSEHRGSRSIGELTLVKCDRTTD
ncbi:hypothetical protein KQX54_021788 [Cotesia glomerata]|uniref:Uncharacterized protein n=1 Tax=Cotesia glomerata TaxID=32391 RepID=A0AAV7J7G3_COTGL|nr:hypothetical protein KQX54_021788 [Cotesia glomerata]